jgi:hypothetical protein
MGSAYRGHPKSLLQARCPKELLETPKGYEDEIEANSRERR